MDPWAMAKALGLVRELDLGDFHNQLQTLPSFERKKEEVPSWRLQVVQEALSCIPAPHHLRLLVQGAPEVGGGPWT